jgi:hypothetical protein
LPVGLTRRPGAFADSVRYPRRRPAPSQARFLRLLPTRNSGSSPKRHVRAFSDAAFATAGTMPSADFCRPVRRPLDLRSSRQTDRPPRVMRSHLRAYTRRLYVRAFRASIGLCIYLPAHPALPPRMRFLFVGPAFCLRLPSDSTSRWTPLPSGWQFPLPGLRRTFTFK